MYIVFVNQFLKKLSLPASVAHKVCSDIAQFYLHSARENSLLTLITNISRISYFVLKNADLQSISLLVTPLIKVGCHDVCIIGLLELVYFTSIYLWNTHDKTNVIN